MEDKHIDMSVKEMAASLRQSMEDANRTKGTVAYSLGENMANMLDILAEMVSACYSSMGAENSAFIKAALFVHKQRQAKLAAESNQDRPDRLSWLGNAPEASDGRTDSDEAQEPGDNDLPGSEVESTQAAGSEYQQPPEYQSPYLTVVKPIAPGAGAGSNDARATCAPRIDGSADS